MPGLLSVLGEQLGADSNTDGERLSKRHSMGSYTLLEKVTFVLQ